jgi:hypothetical protein
MATTRIKQQRRTMASSLTSMKLEQQQQLAGIIRLIGTTTSLWLDHRGNSIPNERVPRNYAMKGNNRLWTVWTLASGATAMMMDHCWSPLLLWIMLWCISTTGSAVVTAIVPINGWHLVFYIHCVIHSCIK